MNNFLLTQLFLVNPLLLLLRKNDIHKQFFLFKKHQNLQGFGGFGYVDHQTNGGPEIKRHHDTALTSIDINNLEARVKKQEGDDVQEINKSMNDVSLNLENKKELNEQKVELIGPDEKGTKSCQLKPEVPCCSNSCSTISSGSKVTKSTNKRVTIHMKKNESLQGQFGKLIILPDSLEELFRVAGKLPFILGKLKNLIIILFSPCNFVQLQVKDLEATISRKL